jgi:hypothetical protein
MTTNTTLGQHTKVTIDLRDPAKLKAFVNSFRRHTPEHEAIMNSKRLDDLAAEDFWQRCHEAEMGLL